MTPTSMATVSTIRVGAIEGQKSPNPIVKTVMMERYRESRKVINAPGLVGLLNAPGPTKRSIVLMTPDG